MFLYESLFYFKHKTFYLLCPHSFLYIMYCQSLIQIHYRMKLFWINTLLISTQFVLALTNIQFKSYEYMVDMSNAT